MENKRLTRKERRILRQNGNSDKTNIQEKLNHGGIQMRLHQQLILWLN